MLTLPLGPAAFNLRVDFVAGEDTALPLDVVSLNGRVWGCRRKTTAAPAAGPDWMLMFDGVGLALDLKYDVGQYYWFEDDLARPGLFSCLGGVITNFSTRYPSAAAYFETEHGKKRLITKAEYDALHVHVWHTNADGSKVGFQGIGGVNGFVWDKAADTLTLPDLAGMSPEMIGDGLDLGESQGDAARRTVGSFQAGDASTNVTGPFFWSQNGTATVASGSAPWNVVKFDTYRTGPVGPKNQTRAWGSLCCVYLGQPAS